MAKQIEGVYEKVIKVARNEFANKGFQKASLRTIAAKSGTTTGSIYTRFGDKEGLFSAIIEPLATELLRMFTKTQENFHNFTVKDQKDKIGEYTSQEMDYIIDFMYEHFVECKLLLEASQGTKYENFMDEFIDIEEQYTHMYIKTVGCNTFEDPKFTENIIHMVTTAYFESFFEVIRHNVQKEEAKRYIEVLGNYHLSGFKAIFKIK